MFTQFSFSLTLPELYKVYLDNAPLHDRELHKYVHTILVSSDKAVYICLLLQDTCPAIA